MATPVVKSTNGFGTPVTVVASGGLPVDIATNGFGIPIIEVASGGLPITYAQGGGVVPPFSPADITGLWGAWQLSNSTSDADGIASVPAAFGGSRTLAGGPTTQKPDILVAGGPNDKTIAQFTAATSEYLAISEAYPLATSFTAIIPVAPRSAAGVQGILLGKLSDSSGANRIRFVSGANPLANLAVRPNGAGAETNVPYPAGYSQATDASRMDVIAIVYDAAAGTMKIGIGGDFGTATAVGTGGFNFDCIGRAGSGYAGILIGDPLFYSRALSDAEVIQLQGYLADFASSKFYVAANGNDSNKGWSASAPLLLPATADTKASRAGDQVLLRKGDRFTTALAPTVGGTAAKKKVLGAYGTGARPQLWGAAPATGIASSGGGIYTHADAAAPAGIIICPLGASRMPASATDFAWMIKAASSIANDLEWSWTGGVTTMRSDSVDLTTVEVVIIPAGTVNGFAPSSTASYYDLDGVSVRFWSSFGVRPFNGGGEYRNFDFLGNCNDGCGPSISSGLTLDGTDGEASFNGSKPETSGQGDGWSDHGVTKSTLTRVKARWNRVGGFRHEGGTTTVHKDCIAEGNKQDYEILAQGGTGGTMLIDGGSTTVTTASALTKAVNAITGGATTVTVKNHTINRQSGSGGAACNANGNAIVDGGGNVLNGFSSLF
jgi:hypothetical protein